MENIQMIIYVVIVAFAGGVIYKVHIKRALYNKISKAVSLMEKSSDIFFFVEKEKELRFLQKVFWKSYPRTDVPRLDDSSLEYNKVTNSLFVKHYTELRKKTNENCSVEKDIEKAALALGKIKYTLDCSYEKEHFPQLKKTALMQIAENRVEGLHEDLVAKYSNIEWQISEVLDKIKAAKKARNDVSLLKDKIKEIKNFLKETQKKIKEMQK